MKNSERNAEEMRRPTDSPNWGGHREGSGRKKLGKHQFSMRVTNAEEKAIRSLLARMRKKEAPKAKRAAPKDSE